jgi:8-oxo-dGTP pyrophosphatase MutT (NUDIX family)
MHRKDLLHLLNAHAGRKLDAHEAAMTAETIRFVETHQDCLQRELAVGHITGSAWVVDPSRTRTLLTHHRKLEKWLQLGGHADGDPNLLAVALREAREESGLTKVRATSREIFDVDRHWIPARGEEMAHWHYDIRFMLEADPSEPLKISSESKELAWVDVAEVTKLNPEDSMTRMARKTMAGSGSKRPWDAGVSHSKSPHTH